MKKKTILGVALTLMLLGSLIGASVPTSAGTLSWSAFSPVPSTTSSVLAPGVSVTDLAVYGDGEIIYAGSNTSALYKSTDRGVTWSTISVTANATDLVAVAPDDGDMVVYVDQTDLKVRVTTDGGTNWGILGVPAIGSVTMDDINDIDISAASAGTNYVAVAGEDGTLAKVLTYNIGSASPAWKDISGISGGGFWASSANASAVALAYSPNFASDQVLAVVTATWTNTSADAYEDYVKLELFSENQDVWNSTGTFDGYAATIISNDGLTGEPTACSIGLAPDYLGGDDSMRLAYVGITLAGDSDAQANNGVWRMSDTVAKGLKTGTAVQAKSVAFDGTTLVAGRNDNNTTYYCADPTATTPTVSTTGSLKRPGSSETCTATVVAWAGADVVAGTSGVESAFSVSRNNGKSYNDISLIDTDLTAKTDVAVSSDGSVVYMATDNGSTRGSLWRYASSWERVLAVAKDGLIIREAPDDPDVVYVADQGSTQVYYTGDGGVERWQSRTSRYAVQDLAVETDGATVYIIVASNGKVSKSTNAGFTWGSAKSTNLTSGNMLTSLSEGNLLAASGDGYVSYSTDSGDTWTKIGKQVGDSGNNVVATASGLASGDFIYTALQTTDKNIYRWEIDSSTYWKSIYSDTDTYQAYGIILEDGVLYVNTANSEASQTFRTLGPTWSPNVYWSTMTSGAVFNRTPQGLAVGGGKLWAIDTETADVLYSYTDTLTEAAPKLVGPKQDFANGINPISGNLLDMTFVWEKPSDEVTSYVLVLAYDQSFDEEVKDFTISSSSTTVSAVVGGSATNEYAFQPDSVYFWRVRVASDGPIRSPWSEVRRFSTAEATVTPPVTVEVPPPSPAPEIKVEVPPPTQVNIPAAPAPAVPEPLMPAWAWMTIIIIGAILVIALIVLIVRTRRPV
jgi:hypothetical protein